MVSAILDPAGRLAVEQAVAQAERTTAAEIVCVLTQKVPASPQTALLAGAIASLVLVPLVVWAGLDLPRLGAGWEVAHLAAEPMQVRAALFAYGLLQTALFAVVAGGLSVAAVRRALTPGFVKQARVHRAAMQQFHALPLAAGEGRTGLVIFVSMLDRQAEIVAEAAVHKACGEAVWKEAIEALRHGMRSGDPSAALVEAVRICGAALATHLPPGADNPNLLPDGVREI